MYEGEEKYGKPHGNGTMIYANGDRYIGDWLMGEKNGKGIQKYANNDEYDEYDGQWRLRAIHGYGIMILMIP